MNELIKLLITIFLIISAFFIGVGFNDSQKEKKISELENRRYKVNINITKDKINVEKPENIDVVIKK
ncbi:MAG: hypothetical protein PHS92_05190 [Candidatus Gracilibacteria bacterium]|nr:hypothetical protein [Candidatus Gracilibacteria bacterium]